MCAWCDKLVQKPQEALVYNAEHLHFSCIRARLLDEYTIAEGEDIVYIGQGSFAHVAYENPQTKTSYHVLSRIAVETEEERYQFLRFLEDEKEVPGGIDFYDDGIPSGFGDSSRTDNLDIRDLVLGSYQDEMEGPEW
ncbi:hypothetical protein CSB45_00795 [candidate division KSB3 bacterium]|uniref:Uncharacterized protein n=1 Tax=candidate division KSB3 bacterium TaxID=2044937 RepID=A0A2G6EDF8_9BACT|nr:MAG: hypothetical protein CSB45_00795 [candidate division KSB3 bacterium]